MQQMSLFDTRDDNRIIDEIKELDISTMTPLEAMNVLYHLQSEVKNRW
jgi:DNA mismatch repair protein MutS